MSSAAATGPAPIPSAQPAAPIRTFRSITREQFLLRETRIVAQLRLAGVSNEEIVRRAAHDNIFQYPTKTMTGNIARTCLMRLDALGPAVPAAADGGQADPASLAGTPASQITALIANGAPAQAAQANIYAMARACAIVWEFLVRVVGWHYSTLDYSLTIPDINAFLAEMQSEQPAVAAWSESTLVKTRRVLRSALLHAGHLEAPGSDRLVPVLLDPILERAIRANADNQILPAFNCMEVA